MDEYAKLIADVAIAGRRGLSPAAREGTKYWAFQTRTFKKLVSGQMTPSTVLRENKLLVKSGGECAYCGTTGPLQWEHIIPKSRGGPDSMDNLVLSCSSCNSRKGTQNPAEWYFRRGLPLKEVPRLVMGKLLKLVLEEHRRRNTLTYTTFSHEQELTLSDIFDIFEFSEEKARLQEENARPQFPTDPSRREVFTIGQKGVASPASLREIVTVLEIAFIVDVRLDPPSRSAWSIPNLWSLFGSQLVVLPVEGTLRSTIAALQGRILVLMSSKAPWECEERINLGDDRPEWAVVHIHHSRHKSSPVTEAECIPHQEMVAAFDDRGDGNYKSFLLHLYSPTRTMTAEQAALGT